MFFSLSFEKNHAFSACGESVLVVLLESRGHILFTDFIIFLRQNNPLKPATLAIIKTMYEKCLRSFQRFKSVFSPLVQSLNASVKCVLNLDIKFVLLSL